MKLFFALIALSILFISCSSDSGTNIELNKQPSFTPALGTKVSFDYYNMFDDKGKNTELYAAGCYYTVDKIEVVDGKPALVCNFYSPFGQKFNTEMFSYDSLNSKIYMHTSFIDMVIASLNVQIGCDSLPIVINDRWFTIADYKNNEWTIAENSFVDFPLRTSSISGNCIITARKSAQDSINVNNKKYCSTTFVLEAKLTGLLQDTSMDVKDEPISISMSNEIVFVDGIGKIKNTMRPIQINMYYLTGSQTGSLMIPTKVN